jgi:glycine/D-amino acid oxidase-like deaminating enzyme
MQRNGRLPDHDFKSQPLWWDEDPPFRSDDETLPGQCDVAVIGGGSPACRPRSNWQRNGSRVVVLEADAFGFNASGRNSAGISFGLDTEQGGRLAPLVRRHGAAGGGTGARGAAESVTFLEKFIAEQAIDCDYHRRGRLSCAPGPAQYEALSRRLDPLNRLFDADAHMVPSAPSSSRRSAPIASMA